MINVSALFIVCLGLYTWCGASALQSVKIQRSIGDAAVRHSTLEYELWFVQKVFDRTLKYIIRSGTNLSFIRHWEFYVQIILILRTPPSLLFVYGDCTWNHTVKKYNSYRVNFWQKSLVYQEGISGIFCENSAFKPIVSFEINNSRDCVRYENRFLVIYSLFSPQTTDYENNLYVHSKKILCNPKCIYLNWNKF